MGWVGTTIPGMNEAIAFDTHRFVKNLTESGFTEQQAAALAREQVQRLNSNMATKIDVQALRANLDVVKAELEAKNEAATVDLLKWMVMAMVAQGTLIVGLVVAFVKLL